MGFTRFGGRWVADQGIHLAFNSQVVIQLIVLIVNNELWATSKWMSCSLTATQWLSGVKKKGVGGLVWGWCWDNCPRHPYDHCMMVGIQLKKINFDIQLWWGVRRGRRIKEFHKIWLPESTSPCAPVHASTNSGIYSSTASCKYLWNTSCTN